MMRHILMVMLLFCYYSLFSQVKIHAHNDYEKPEPLVNALRYKVFSVEADVYPGSNNLFVAHNKVDINPGHTLTSLYLEEMVALFKKNKGYITSDHTYRLALVIDIKENFEEVIRQLIKLLEPNLRVFDRRLNPNAVQVIISGDRGPAQQWSNYPPYLYFDGRPAESYNDAVLNRVAMISDSYARYAGDTTRIANVVSAVHRQKKPLRFWGAPDDQVAWKSLHSQGVDIINTDKVAECAQFFRANSPAGK